MFNVKPIILGCSGVVLTDEERALFSAINPFGFILFQRNCAQPQQVRQLTSDLKEAVGRTDVLILIDQEGGRVARLKPPVWPTFPAGRELGRLFEKNADLGKEALLLHTKLTSRTLLDLGINGNCYPVLDLLIEGASSAIGDRAFSSDPSIVAQCGRIVVDGMLSQGVFPVVKHLPGHGRVVVDPHIELPHVETDEKQLRESDFLPFKSLKDAPLGMNCHVLFKALDPDQPASLSVPIHRRIIRDEIGFDGLLISDDLAMGALRLPLKERGLAALGAGADLALYCTGVLEESKTICEELPTMSYDSVSRWERAKKECKVPSDPVQNEDYQRLTKLVKQGSTSEV